MPEAAGLAEREVSISWSRLKDHEECQEKAYLLGRGFRSPVTDIRVFFKGTVADRCMRQWLDQDNPELGWMAAHVDTILDKEVVEARETGDGGVNWKHPGDKDEVRAWVKTCVTKLEPLLVKYALPYDYQPALRFKVPINLPYLDGTLQRIWLNGELDLLCEVPRLDETVSRRFHVWDLKATENDQYYKKVIGQLVFYDIAIRAKYGAWPVASGIFQPMCLEPMVPFTLTMDHRREMMARIERAVRQQWAGQHHPKESDAGCNWCPVQHACPKFALAKPGKAPFFS